MSDNNVKSELSEYVSELSDVQQRLTSLKSKFTSETFTYAPQLDLLLVATEGLLNKIQTVDPSTISLGQIVSISDEVKAVMTSSRQFILRHQPTITTT